MRPFLAALPIAAFVVLAGCGSSTARIAGTWKGEIKPSAKSKNPLEAGMVGFVSALTGPMTFEFNPDGRFKASISLGSGTGTYTVSGNEITLVSDKNDGKNSINVGSHFILSGDGKTLTSKKEFESDPDLVLTKQE